LRFGVPDQLHKNLVLPTALATKATHDFVQRVLALAGLALQRRRARGDVLQDVRDEVEDFF
jgi:hypothetical protein